MLNDTIPNILNRFSNIFAVLALTVCVSGIAMAQSVLSDDAHTSTSPRDVDTNFGTNPNLAVSPTNNVYLKFKLSPTLPAGIQGSDVAKATLKLYLGNLCGRDWPLRGRERYHGIRRGTESPHRSL